MMGFKKMADEAGLKITSFSMSNTPVQRIFAGKFNDKEFWKVLPADHCQVR
jgi:hypothetical protein